MALLCVFLTQCRHTPRPPTFPLAAVIALRLQLRMRKGVVCRGSPQQLLGTAAAQAVLAAVGGSDSFGRSVQTPALPPEGTARRTGSLTDGRAGNHGEVLTETRRGWESLRGRVQQKQHVPVTSDGLNKTTDPVCVFYRGAWLVLLFYSVVRHPFRSDLFLYTFPSRWTLWYAGDSRPHLPDPCWDSDTHLCMHTHTHTQPVLLWDNTSL